MTIETKKIHPQTMISSRMVRKKSSGFQPKYIFNQRWHAGLSITYSNRISRHGKEDRGSSTSSVAKLRILCLVRRAAGEREVDKI